MADATISPTPQVDNVVDTPSPSPPKKPREPRRTALNRLYALPAPMRTFPLPTLVPHNPLSLFHILYVWLSQKITPPSSNIDPLYQGWWSPETRSIHVTDPRSIRGLWEQGFYGKGNLSRSEPDWINREKTRRGTKSKVTSEEVVLQRRADRQKTKWERARLQMEIVETQRALEEAQDACPNKAESPSSDEDPFIDTNTTLSVSDGQKFVVNTSDVITPPVGPLELLRLPNSALDLKRYLEVDQLPGKSTFSEIVLDQLFYPAPVGPMQLLALPNSRISPEIAPPKFSNHVEDEETTMHTNGFSSSDDLDVAEAPLKMNGNGPANGLGINGHALAPHNTGSSDETEGSVRSDDSSHTAISTPNGSALANGNGPNGSPKIKRQKSVRFSPTVEKNTFIQSDPPSPERAVIETTPVEVEEEPIEDMEHLQLLMEEAFFLAYSLGALAIMDPFTKAPIPTQKLFDLFRKSSYVPPVANQMMSPDDPFMLNYVVYHHYRSLGWCVRGGAKFACDFMLYNRGPVFSHAEFAVIILPSYSDAYWSGDAFLQNYVKKKEHRTWSWMHCIHRVITQVKKTLILVYVDIPKPLEHDTAATIGIDGVLERYRVREIIMKRWQVNRERGVGK
jgi:tRNA-splicing endonuclease subunit Sen2